MTAPKDGGSAFPLAIAVSPAGDMHQGWAGMSLRDWFAGMALIALGGTNPNLPDDRAGQGWPDAQELASRKAKWAYMQADAMIAARGQA